MPSQDYTADDSSNRCFDCSKMQLFEPICESSYCRGEEWSVFGRRFSWFLGKQLANKWWCVPLRINCSTLFQWYDCNMSSFSEKRGDHLRVCDQNFLQNKDYHRKCVIKIWYFTRTVTVTVIHIEKILNSLSAIHYQPNGCGLLSEGLTRFVYAVTKQSQRFLIYIYSPILRFSFIIDLLKYVLGWYRVCHLTFFFN